MRKLNKFCPSVTQLFFISILSFFLILNLFSFFMLSVINSCEETVFWLSLLFVSFLCLEAYIIFLFIYITIQLKHFLYRLNDYV